MENVLPTIFQLIYDNEKICGDPFVDPNWLPAFEDCQLDCDISSQICQENVKKTFPGQRCMNLPAECSRKIKKMLDINPDTPALQLPLAPLTTFAPPTTPTSLFVNQVRFTRRESSMPRISPQMPETRPIMQNFVNNSLQPPPLRKAFRDDGFRNNRPPSAQPLPPAYGKGNIRTPTPSSIHYGTVKPSSAFITEAPEASTSHEYDDEQNIETEPTPEVTNAGGNFMANENSPGGFTPSFGRFVNYEATAPPTLTTDYKTSYRPPLTHQYRNPLSWQDLSGRLKKRPFYSIEDTGTVIDYSARCCEWALDGLCDRSWQRVRQLCPKSCGTVVCAAVEGALSCNRAIDVDVLDCFQRRRFNLAHGSKIQRDDFQTPSVPKRLGKIFGGYKKKELTKQEYSLSKAFAVENEIRNFQSAFLG